MEGELEVLLSSSSPEEIGWGSQATKDFIAGAAGGMMGVIAGQPLDTLRIRLQQRECRSRSILGVWRAMAGAEGVRGLFRGMSYPLYTTSLQNAVTFQAQKGGERAMAAAGAAPGLATTCVAGMFAGAFQTFISSPVELLKIRLQLQRAKPGAPGYVGPLGMLQAILRDEGVPGLFRGCGVTMLRDTPSYGLYFVLYGTSCAALEALRQRLVASADKGAGGGGSSNCSSGSSSSSSSSSSSGSSSSGSSSNGSSGASDSQLVQAVAGGIAGMLAWLSVYPLDIVKSRIQAQPAHASRYKGAWHCMVRSMQEEGPGVLSKGLGATLGRAFIVNGVIFATFEASMSAMATGRT